MSHHFALGRRAGLLLPLSSVRGPRGDLGSYADVGAVARFLRSTGSTLWQLLPLSEVSPGQDSPYAASSSSALEPVYIDLDSVPEHGSDASLTPGERVRLEVARSSSLVDFAAYREVKRAALGRAWAKFRDGELRGQGARARDFARFREEHRSWLTDYALYRALHDRRHKSWRDWEPALRTHGSDEVAAQAAALADAVSEIAFVQWIADEQWRRGRAEANSLGVKMIGDLPFMVAEDSADVWSLQRFFRFDATVGVPPDAYSAEGQDWGLPVPRWDEMRDQGDPWLRARADRAAELYDGFRVDHVVGLYRTFVRPLPEDGVKPDPYFVPAAPPAQKAQGERILTLLGEKAEVLAEDLGTVPDFVRASLAAIELPGTKVLRWENDKGVPRDPRRFSRISLCVTGTHDTEAMATWWESLAPWERKLQLGQEALRGLSGEDAAKFTPRTWAALLELAYGAASEALLLPITDALGWRDRMNTPGTVGTHNWTWRLPWRLAGELESAAEMVAVATHLTNLAKRTARLP